MQPRIIIQNAFIHKSESRVNATLIDYVIKVYELKQGPLGLIGELTLLECTSKVNSLSYYRESTTHQYPM